MTRMMQRDVIGKSNRTGGVRAHSYSSKRLDPLVGPGDGRMQCEFCGAYRKPLEGTTDILPRHKQPDRTTPCLRSLPRLEEHQATLRHLQEKRQEILRKERRKIERAQELRRLLGRE